MSSRVKANHRQLHPDERDWITSFDHFDCWATFKSRYALAPDKLLKAVKIHLGGLASCRYKQHLELWIAYDDKPKIHHIHTLIHFENGLPQPDKAGEPSVYDLKGWVQNKKDKKVARKWRYGFVDVQPRTSWRQPELVKTYNQSHQAWEHHTCCSRRWKKCRKHNDCLYHLNRDSQ
jgi:hypothetical protein